MTESVLTKVVQFIPTESSDEEISKQIAAALSNTARVYSYLIYSIYNKDVHTGWRVEYMFNQFDKYNTLLSKDIITDITNIIVHNRKSTKRVIGYKQPSIDILLKIYAPLIKLLAKQQSDKWTDLEYEDAFVMCQLVMINLYRKGYYIHKSLLKRAFINYILMEFRSLRSKPEVYSFEQVQFNDDSNTELTLADTIHDEKFELEQERNVDKAAFEAVFAEIKEILIDMIGERQFEQLLRDYGSRNTTAWSRKKMQTIKNKFKSVGFTIDILKEYL